MIQESHIPGWFGGYVDVTLRPFPPVRDTTGQGTSITVLSFIGSDPARPCEPSWGGSYTLDQAGEKLDLDGHLEVLREAGNEVAVSFGGQKGTELAVACTDPEELSKAYAAVITRYGLNVVDLDVEGKGASDAAAAERRAAAMARLQSERPADRPLHVWLTLPVSRDGLTPAAMVSVETMLNAGVDVSGVNIMTMNFGPLPPGRSMLDASVAAAEATQRALTGLFGKAGMPSGEDDVWARMGLTPMIGVNDVEGNVFTLKDAEGLNSFARERGIARMSLWSLNRDEACASDSQHGALSHNCSGLQQENGMFAKLLGNAFNGQQR